MSGYNTKFKTITNLTEAKATRHDTLDQKVSKITFSDYLIDGLLLVSNLMNRL